MREVKNQVRIVGEVIESFTFSHKVYGEAFYAATVKVPRYSEAYDVIRIIVSDRLVDVSADWEGCWISVDGQFRSHSKKQPDGRAKLELFVFVFNVEPLEASDMPIKEMNYIVLDGYLCKTPVYRETPRGRKITDILFAVNRAGGKSDYIPCICWERNALYAAAFEPGAHFILNGRIQSRVYHKPLGDGNVEERTAWEVSVSTIQLVEEEGEGNHEDTNDTNEESQ